VSGETHAVVVDELESILAELRRDDPEFDGSLAAHFARPSYEIPATHELPAALHAARRPLPGKDRFTGMSFWTDAAVLGSAGIPSVLFGPGGAGLHSIEEYVEIADVLRCRDTLAALARGWCPGQGA
jgi:acetylornithine deacetylase